MFSVLFCIIFVLTLRSHATSPPQQNINQYCFGQPKNSLPNWPFFCPILCTRQEIQYLLFEGYFVVLSTEFCRFFFKYFLYFKYFFFVMFFLFIFYFSVLYFEVYVICILYFALLSFLFASFGFCFPFFAIVFSCIQYCVFYEICIFFVHA